MLLLEAILPASESPMRLIVLAALLAATPSYAQYVYRCSTAPTSLQGAASGACSVDDAVLPASVQTTDYVAASATGDWGTANWEQVASVPADKLIWSTSSSNENGAGAFVRKSTLLGGVPQPPTPPVWSEGASTLTWDAVTTYSDGKPLPGGAAVTYRVEQRVNGGTFATIAAGLTAPTLRVTGLPAGTYGWRGYAVLGGVESDPSAEFTKKIEAPTNPPPPTDPCVLRPFTFRVNTWPAGNTGSRSLSYTANKTIARLDVTSNATRPSAVRATDYEGCQISVSR